MPPDIYNPCQDGFYAKVWECLRRNEEFRKAYRAIANAPDFERKYDEYQVWEHFAKEDNEENDFAEIVLSSLLSGPAWDLCKIWRQHPETLRAKLESVYAPAMPLAWDAPSASECCSDRGYY